MWGAFFTFGLPMLLLGFAAGACMDDHKPRRRR